MAFGFKHGSKNIIRFVAKPTVTGAFVFDNASKSAVISGYDAKAMTISGTQTATSAGTYSLTFTLNKGYMWSDKTKDPVTRSWSIAKRSITIPALTNGSHTWAVNRTFAPTISGVNTTYVSQSGTTSSVNAGSWTITWTLRFPNDTVWTDNTSGNKTATWSVAKLTLAVPTISSARSFAFIEGTTRSITVSGFNGTYETQSGTTSTSALGTYTLTWALRYPANTQWSGGTTTNKTASWSIVWTNGTSHYNADLYNRGWYKANSIQFGKWTDSSDNYALKWNADNFTFQFGRLRLAEDHEGKTFHVLVKALTVTGSPTYPKTFELKQVKSDTWGAGTNLNDTTGKVSVDTSTFVEAYGAHNTASYRRFGFFNSSGTSSSQSNQYAWMIQRIWLT